MLVHERSLVSRMITSTSCNVNAAILEQYVHRRNERLYNNRTEKLNVRYCKVAHESYDHELKLKDCLKSYLYYCSKIEEFFTLIMWLMLVMTREESYSSQ